MKPPMDPVRVLVALACATTTAVSATAVAYGEQVTGATGVRGAAGVKGAAGCVAGERERRSDSAVDDGEIRWTSATKYDDARTWAGKVWQTGSLSRIKIRPDSATTVNDLDWRDYSKADGKGAYYEHHGGVADTDVIHLNRKSLDKPGKYASTELRRHVAAHELGHALGLCHKSEQVASLMWPAPLVTMPITEPTDTDKANYKKLWG
ncbi:matrixin family metalloprotease [Streptomyces sp. BE147]|uniref:matrixin family metalloprotease n=1 Tax=unclassified Streptomyces TaxID=2593676 RepID=UPI002E7A2D43|nr:matrixin family metalloprotease [Streptomyces sp. BE147]MEE1736072.1 matrixin family metalloprotease [Streptomyces sp. BE147]